MNNNYPKPIIIMHWITFVLVVIVGLHACAALIHHFLFKDNVLKSMLFKK